MTACWCWLLEGQTPECGVVEVKAADDDALPDLGKTTFDIHLNDRAFWRNVPTNVWKL